MLGSFIFLQHTSPSHAISFNAREISPVKTYMEDIVSGFFPAVLVVVVFASRRTGK
jgi:hypothetical protein